MKLRFLLQCALVFALFAAVVVYTGRLVGLAGLGLDVAGRSPASLTPATEAFVSSLEGRLSITYLVSSRDDMPSHFKGVEGQVLRLLAALRELSPERIDYRLIDPQVSGAAGAAYAARKKVSPVSVRKVHLDELAEKKIWSSLVLAYQGHPEILIQGIETAHLPHLERLIVQHLRSLGEPPQASFALAAPPGYERFPQILSQQGPVVNVDLDTPAPHLPHDTDIFFWLEPRLVTDAHIRQLRSYVASGRTVVLAGSAYSIDYLPAEADGDSVRYRVRLSSPAWQTLLRAFGLRPLPDLLMDRNASAVPVPLAGGQMAEVDAPFHLRNLPAFRDFHNLRTPARGGISFVAASALEIDPSRVAAAGFRAHVLATTTEHAWVSALPSEPFTNGDVVSGDITVPKQNLMVMLSTDDMWSGQVLVLASASPFRNGIISRSGYGHTVVIKDLVRSFADPQRLVLSRVERPRPQSLPPLSGAERIFWRGVSVFLVPVLLVRRYWRGRGARDLRVLLALAGRGAAKPLIGLLLLVLLLGAGLTRLTVGVDATADQLNTPAPETLELLGRNRGQLQAELIISQRAAMPVPLKGIERRMKSLFADADLALAVRRPASLSRAEIAALQALGAAPFEAKRVQRDTLVSIQVWSAMRLTKGGRTAVIPRLDAATSEHVGFLLAAALDRLDGGRSPLISVVSDLPRLSPAEALEDYQKKGLSAPRGVDVYSRLKVLLRDYGYRLHHVNARYPSIDPDSDAVLWLQPRRDSRDVIELFSDYLSRGGSAVVAMQHFNIQQRQYRGTGFETVYWPQPQFQDFDRYLRLLGVEQVREVLMDRTRHHLQLDTQVNRTAVREYDPQEVALPFLIRSVGAHYAPDSPLTENLGDLLFIWGNRFALDESLLNETGLRPHVVISTSDQAWSFAWKGGWLPPEVLTPGDLLPGRQPLAVWLEGTFPPAAVVDDEEGRTQVVLEQRASDAEEGRLLLLGCSEMFKSHRLHAPGFQHSQLLLNSIALLAHGRDMARLQARHRPPRGFAFRDAASKALWRLFVVGAGPLAIAGLGLVRYQGRRARRPA